MLKKIFQYVGSGLCTILIMAVIFFVSHLFFKMLRYVQIISGIILIVLSVYLDRSGWINRKKDISKIPVLRLGRFLEFVKDLCMLLWGISWIFLGTRKLLSILFVIIGGLAYLAGILFPKNLNFAYGDRPLDEKKRNKVYKYEEEYELYFPAICRIFLCCGMAIIFMNQDPLRYSGVKYLLMLVSACAVGSLVLYIRIVKTEKAWLNVYKAEYILMFIPTLFIFCFGSIWTVNILDVKQTQVLYKTVSGYYNNTRGGIGVTLTDGSDYQVGEEERRKVKIGDTIEITEYVGVLGLPWSTWSVCSNSTEIYPKKKRIR